MLRRFQQAGHRPIAVVGGATGMIGDPSGKSEERNLLSVDALRANVAGIETQMRRFLDFDAGPTQAVLVNNYDWMSHFSYLEFLPRRRQELSRQRDARQGDACKRGWIATTRHVVHRVQLHAAAGLRLRASERALTAASCKSAAATSGATSPPASTSRGGCTACSSTA